MRPYIFAIIALMAISGGLVEGQDESSIKLELLYEKPFDDLYSTSEGFPPAEIQQILKRDDIPDEDKEWLLNSIRIEVARREKLLYTDDGDIIQLPDGLKSIVTSDNLKYLIVHAIDYDYGSVTKDEYKNIKDNWLIAYKRSSHWQTMYENAELKVKNIYLDSMNYWTRISDSLSSHVNAIEYSTKEGTSIIVLETETGTVLWKKEALRNVYLEKGEEIIPPSFISNNGKTAITIPTTGTMNQYYTSIYFHDEKGKVLKTVSGLYGESRCHDLSSDGELFCTLTRLTQNDTASIYVAAYDKNGTLLWNTPLHGTWPPNNPCIAISPNHKYIAASVAGTFLIDNNGTIRSQYDFITYKPKFSLDDNYILLGVPKRTIYFIQTDNGQIVWNKNLGGEPYSDPFVAKGGRAIFYADGHLLDYYGNIIWENMNTVKNTLGISPSGNLFVPTTNPYVIIFYLPTGGTYEE